jgi:hypothetical protein
VPPLDDSAVSKKYVSTQEAVSGWKTLFASRMDGVQFAAAGGGYLVVMSCFIPDKPFHI